MHISHFISCQIREYFENYSRKEPNNPHLILFLYHRGPPWEVFLLEKCIYIKFTVTDHKEAHKLKFQFGVLAYALKSRITSFCAVWVGPNVTYTPIYNTII